MTKKKVFTVVYLGINGKKMEFNFVTGVEVYEESGCLRFKDTEGWEHILAPSTRWHVLYH